MIPPNVPALLPCPFCATPQSVGDEGVGLDSDAFDNWYVICGKCGSQTSGDHSHDDAIRVWNTREIPESRTLDLARKYFEAWAVRQPSYVIKDIQRYADDHPHYPGEYGHYDTKQAWDIWQAAWDCEMIVWKLVADKCAAFADLYREEHAWTREAQTACTEIAEACRDYGTDIKVEKA